MKHIIKCGAILVLLVIQVMTLSVNGAFALGNTGSGAGPEVSIQIMTLINGLEAGDKAILDISPEGEMSHENAIVSKTVVGDGQVLYVTLSADLTDGSYQVAIDATSKYFREPRGYFFTVRDSKVYNPESRAIAFDLIPPSARDYEPSRNSFHFADSVDKIVPPPAIAEEGKRPIRSEPFRDLSAPKKDPMPNVGEFGTRGTKYYTNYGTSAANRGIRGALTPVDTGVSHPLSGTDFVAGHVYSKYVGGGNTYWIEVGWLDCSWKSDYRYLYTYNSTDNYWEYHGTLSDNSTLTVYTQRSSGTTWKAYWYNGSSWIELESVDINFSSANNTFIGGETDDADASPPSLPRSDITEAKLWVQSFWGWYAWDTWDTEYYTIGYDYSPYHKHVDYSYYDWYMHTD